VETCGSSQQRGEFYLRLGVAYDHLGDYQNGIPFARLAIREGTQAEDRGTVAKAQIILMHANWFAGDYKAGLANAEIAATAFRTARDPLWQGMARWTEAWLHIHLGDFDAAAAARTDIVAAASQLGSRRLETNGHALAGWISIRRGKLTEGIEACQHALLCAPDPLAKAIVLTILGEGQTRAGDLQGALANLTAAHAMFHQFPMLHSESWAAGHLVDVHIKLGEVEVARDLALKLESYSKASGFRLLEGLARRGLGRAELSRGSADVAESHLRYAADRFVSLGARYDLANTYLDLAATAALKNDAHLKGQYLLKARRLFRVMNALAPIADPSLC
jgi:tetratricopeptide (TPR) repeat protein